MTEQLPRTDWKTLRSIARARLTRENEQPAADIYNDTRDTIARLRAIRNHNETWTDDHDDAVVRRLSGAKYALDNMGHIIWKPVNDIQFGDVGIKAFVRDLSPEEEAA